MKTLKKNLWSFLQIAFFIVAAEAAGTIFGWTEAGVLRCLWIMLAGHYFNTQQDKP